MGAYKPTDFVLLAIYDAAQGVPGEFIPDEKFLDNVKMIPEHQILTEVLAELAEMGFISRTMGHVILSNAGKGYIEGKPAEWRAAIDQLPAKEL